MSKPSDYVWIRLWGRQLGSYDYYIENQQAKAAAMNAPLTAVFEKHKDGGRSYEKSGEWATAEEITNPDTQRSLRLAAERAGVKIPETWE